MAKLSNFIKKKGKSVSRDSNAPLHLRNQGTTYNTTSGRNSRNESNGVLKFYPIVFRHPMITDENDCGFGGCSELDEYYTMDIWVSFELYPDAEMIVPVVRVDSVEIDLPEYFNLKNVDVWNTILKTKWANNIPEINGLPHDEWPSGTNPAMLSGDLFEIAKGIQKNHTIWCSLARTDVDTDFDWYLDTFRYGGPNSPAEQNQTCINYHDMSWDTPEHFYWYDDRPHFTMMGSSNKKGHFGFMSDAKLVEPNDPNNIFHIFGGEPTFYKFLRIENITPAFSGNNNLFNLCLSDKRIKATGHPEPYDTHPSETLTSSWRIDTQGMCTSDLIEENGIDLSDRENRQMICQAVGGVLCRDNDHQCVYHERECSSFIPIDPVDCDCRTFDCIACSDTLSHFAHQNNNVRCCRECCDDVDDVTFNGCTDRRACNYWSLATEDDGTCWYPRDNGWCDCNGNLFDECDVCGGAGVSWGQNASVSIEGISIYPETGCCPEIDLREVYFDRQCDGVGDSNFPFIMCVNNISSVETRNYCLQVTNNECAQCFVQSSGENIECESGIVDCAGLCDGDSVITNNPYTNRPQCCTERQLDTCGVCFGDNSHCQCGENIVSTVGCVCGCTDSQALNYNPDANWPCGNRLDNECWDDTNTQNGCCWYSQIPDMECPTNELLYEGECYRFGDLNKDGTVNIQDIILQLSHILGDTEFSELQNVLGDVNQDGSMDILDIIAIVNQIIGDSNEFHHEINYQSDPSVVDSNLNLICDKGHIDWWNCTQKPGTTESSVNYAFDGNWGKSSGIIDERGIVHTCCMKEWGWSK